MRARPLEAAHSRPPDLDTAALAARRSNVNEPRGALRHDAEPAHTRSPSKAHAGARFATNRWGDSRDAEGSGAGRLGQDRSPSGAAVAGHGHRSSRRESQRPYRHDIFRLGRCRQPRSRAGRHGCDLPRPAGDGRRPIGRSGGVPGASGRRQGPKGRRAVVAGPDVSG